MINEKATGAIAAVAFCRQGAGTRGFGLSFVLMGNQWYDVLDTFMKTMMKIANTGQPTSDDRSALYCIGTNKEDII